MGRTGMLLAVMLANIYGGFVADAQFPRAAMELEANSAMNPVDENNAWLWRAGVGNTQDTEPGSAWPTNLADDSVRYAMRRFWKSNFYHADDDKGARALSFSRAFRAELNSYGGELAADLDMAQWAYIAIMAAEEDQMDLVGVGGIAGGANASPNDVQAKDALNENLFQGARPKLRQANVRGPIGCVTDPTDAGNIRVAQNIARADWRGTTQEQTAEWDVGRYSGVSFMEANTLPEWGTASFGTVTVNKAGGYAIGDKTIAFDGGGSPAVGSIVRFADAGANTKKYLITAVRTNEFDIAPGLTAAVADNATVSQVNSGVYTPSLVYGSRYLAYMPCDFSSISTEMVSEIFIPPMVDPETGMILSIEYSRATQARTTYAARAACWAGCVPTAVRLQLPVAANG